MSAAVKTEVAVRRVRVLLADRDRILTASWSRRLGQRGLDVHTAGTPAAALALLAEVQFDLILLDCHGAAGELLIKDIRRLSPRTLVLVASSYGTIADAVCLTRAGAFEYLTKPLADDVLMEAVDRGVRQQSLVGRIAAPRAGALDELIGGDPQMIRVFELAEAVADSRSTVLIVGESGTGKSLLARAIHARSPRRARPFVELSCGAMPETLLESELFGHVKGSFTGAIADKPGRFMAADSGTIFLDEINSASPGMQAKLLRVLQEKTFEPVGSNDSRTVDARAILATNIDLQSLVSAGTFRQDLFWRINVVAIKLPALRQRKGDIPRLAATLLQRCCGESGREIVGFTPAAIEALLRHDWPGNVRELENAIERAVLLAKRPMIDVADLPETLTQGGRMSAMPPFGDGRPMPLADAMLEPERAILLAALRRHAFNRQATADELKINRTTLYKKMRQHGLDGPAIEVS